MIYVVLFTILYGLIPFILLAFNANCKGIKHVYPFVFVVFIASLYEFIGSIVLGINVELWFLFYDVLVFFSIHYFFYNLLNRKYTNLFLVFIILFLVLYCILRFGLWLFNYLQISSFVNVYQTLIILFFSIVWFKRIFQEYEIDNLLNSPTFYFISGLLIYYCGTVVLFLSASYIYATDQSNFQYYWLLNIILNFVLRTLLIVGIWKARRE
jgi:hypothetical protein